MKIVTATFNFLNIINTFKAQQSFGEYPRRTSFTLYVSLPMLYGEWDFGTWDNYSYSVPPSNINFREVSEFRRNSTCLNKNL